MRTCPSEPPTERRPNPVGVRAAGCGAPKASGVFCAGVCVFCGDARAGVCVCVCVFCGDGAVFVIHEGICAGVRWARARVGVCIWE